MSMIYAVIIDYFRDSLSKMRCLFHLTTPTQTCSVYVPSLPSSSCAWRALCQSSKCADTCTGYDRRRPERRQFATQLQQTSSRRVSHFTWSCGCTIAPHSPHTDTRSRTEKSRQASYPRGWSPWKRWLARKVPIKRGSPGKIQLWRSASAPTNSANAPFWPFWAAYQWGV